MFQINVVAAITVSNIGSPGMGGVGAELTHHYYRMIPTTTTGNHYRGKKIQRNEN